MLTRIAVLVSGGGTNLQALIDAQKRGALHSGEIVLVVSNRAGAYALRRAEENGIPAEVVEKKSGSQEGFEKELSALLEEFGVELVVLAGFLSILSADFTARWPRRILNVHPSLIPSFCGRGFYGLKVHEAALAAGVKVTGATVHFVNEIPDGGEILLQKAVEVKEGDTPETLQQRVMREAEWKLLPAAAELVAAEIRKKRVLKMNVYETKSMAETLRGNRYPGRGIVIGKSADGKRAVFAYFIMGRSANSRNRIFEEQGEELLIRPFDVSQVKDPSLILYTPVRRLGEWLIVTNGDQTDTIRDYLQTGGSFEGALETREHEPDAPNFTPRISGLLWFEEDDFTYKLSILKSADAGGKTCCRHTFAYPALPGLGHFIHTYVNDGAPLPSFLGEPKRVAIPDDIDDFTIALWDSLDAQNKISLYVRYIDIAGGASESRLKNIHE